MLVADDCLVDCFFPSSLSFLFCSFFIFFIERLMLAYMPFVPCLLCFYLDLDFPRLSNLDLSVFGLFQCDVNMILVLGHLISVFICLWPCLSIWRYISYHIFLLSHFDCPKILLLVNVSITVHFCKCNVTGNF